MDRVPGSLVGTCVHTQVPGCLSPPPALPPSALKHGPRPRLPGRRLYLFLLFFGTLHSDAYIFPFLLSFSLQITVKRREAKTKGKKERYKHLNAEFQRITRRDKKAFFSDQCKEIEENNRMGKTRDLFKKIRDTKGTFHTKMGSIKDRNGLVTGN